MTVAELKNLAKEKNIHVPSKAKKAEIVMEIRRRVPEYQEPAEVIDAEVNRAENIVWDGEAQAPESFKQAYNAMLPYRAGMASGHAFADAIAGLMGGCEIKHLEVIKKWVSREDFAEPAPQETEELTIWDVEEPKHGQQLLITAPPAPVKEVAISYYTDAPESYDGFGTVTLETLKTSSRRGKSVRLVAIQKQNENWQIPRYASGNHFAIKAHEWAENKQYLLEQEPETEPEIFVEPLPAPAAFVAPKKTKIVETEEGAVIVPPSAPAQIVEIETAPETEPAAEPMIVAAPDPLAVFKHELAEAEAAHQANLKAWENAKARLASLKEEEDATFSDVLELETRTREAWEATQVTADAIAALKKEVNRASYVAPTPRTEKPKGERRGSKFVTPQQSVKAVGFGTKCHIVMCHMMKGATVDQLMSATNWPRSYIGKEISTITKKGYGVRNEGGIYHLILPEGVTEIPTK
jgi:hypothetical protein